LEDMVMRTGLDFAPLYRSSVGFDRVFNLLEDALRSPAVDNWPPYDIEKLGDDKYRISIAVAGFAEENLTISAQPNLLIVSGEKAEAPSGEFLHRSIAGRAFTRRFELADHVKVTSATLEHGLLMIDLARELPAEMKPRKISIQTQEKAKQLENRAA